MMMRANGGAHQLSIGSKVILGCVVLLFFAATGMGLLASWGITDIGHYISGLQSRYYIPLYAILLMIFPTVVSSSTPEVERRCNWTIDVLLLWGYVGTIASTWLAVR